MSAEMCAVDSLDVPLSGACSFICTYNGSDNMQVSQLQLCLLPRYLSDSTGSDNGTTRFVAPQCPEVARCGRCDYTCGYCVDAPVATGDMVIFTQTLVHAGTEPKTAEKYVS